MLQSLIKSKKLMVSLLLKRLKIVQIQLEPITKKLVLSIKIHQRTVKHLRKKRITKENISVASSLARQKEKEHSEKSNKARTD